MTRKSQDADVAFIQALAELLRENELSELEVKRDYSEGNSLNVRVARQIQAPATVYAAAPVHAPAAAPLAAPASTDDVAVALPVEDPAQHPGAVTSPMVGTVYLASEPGTAPFVDVGDTVSEGQTLLIVEAMKTMNQIPAPRSGKIKRILVENGAPVEFGAPLMIIE